MYRDQGIFSHHGKQFDKRNSLTIIIVKMNPSARYSILYAPIVREHLKTIENKYYSLIRNEIISQLSFEPEVETRNRKPLKRLVIFGAKWELCCGSDNRFRVFYKTVQRDRQVEILAVGENIGNRLLIGGKEIKI